MGAVELPDDPQDQLRHGLEHQPGRAWRRLRLRGLLEPTRQLELHRAARVRVQGLQAPPRQPPRLELRHRPPPPLPAHHLRGRPRPRCCCGARLGHSPLRPLRAWVCDEEAWLPGQHGPRAREEDGHGGHARRQQAQEGQGDVAEDTGRVPCGGGWADLEPVQRHGQGALRAAWAAGGRVRAPGRRGADGLGGAPRARWEAVERAPVSVSLGWCPHA
mmetsp:Transcript_65433/g.161108  ORF Transcript_65433/g.161108 Transcript_65433/m.161108 type:complete len:217 (+) Transcript_65433:313-963(+)